MPDREKMSSFRRNEPTSNVNVYAYRFLQRSIEIPDDPSQGDWVNKLLRYAELDDHVRELKAKKATPTNEEIEEKQQLHAQLDTYLMRRFATYRKSVLKSSAGLKHRPHERGKDSHVYYFGKLEDFLSKPDVPRYVTKYSIPGRDVGPDNIEYLGKKYKILSLLMGDNIPRAWFVFGEFRHGIPKQSFGDFHTSLRAITIQREIRGKTLAQMTSEERERPEVQTALRAAVQNYRSAQAIIRQACQDVGVSPKIFEMSLDIGGASPDASEERFDPMTYTSPNVMYDERKKRVFFIDMGWGSWSPDRQKVYEHIMSTFDTRAPFPPK